uniref:Putative secreted protein n=1 Tax=Anopheles darlingi TaxID=43151 RepID=A0A2M4D2Y8_ANODA
MRPHFRFWGVSLYLSFFTARALNSRRHSRRLAFPRLSTCALRKTIQPTPPRSIYRYLCQQEEKEGGGSDGGCETTPLSRDNTTLLEAAHGMCTPLPWCSADQIVVRVGISVEKSQQPSPPPPNLTKRGWRALHKGFYPPEPGPPGLCDVRIHLLWMSMQQQQQQKKKKKEKEVGVAHTHTHTHANK